MICDYGCGQEAKYPFKNGKWCCSESYKSCPGIRKKISIKIKEMWENSNSNLNSESRSKKISNSNKDRWKDPNDGFNSTSCRKKMSITKKELHKDPTSKYNSYSYKKKKSDTMKDRWKDPNSGLNSDIRSKKISEVLKFTLKDYKQKYPFLFIVEELRENKNGEIQVHCKNHECENSKEKEGWFTPTASQLSERIIAIETPRGFGESNFYCSQHCKDTCILHGLRGDPYRDTTKPYTSEELKTFNKLVLKRDNEICYYCKEHTATIVHHLRPQKLEPFFALDPDYAISVCIKCHYKYGHPTGSEHSTGNLAKIVCSVESQKFLNQTLENI
jgi:hypothetical protein